MEGGPTFAFPMEVIFTEVTRDPSLATIRIRTTLTTQPTRRDHIIRRTALTTIRIVLFITLPLEFDMATSGGTDAGD